jgi:hypothetical protein
MEIEIVKSWKQILFFICFASPFNKICEAADWRKEIDKAYCKFVLRRQWENAPVGKNNSKDVQTIVVHPHTKYDMDEAAKSGVEEELHRASSGLILISPATRIFNEELNDFVMEGEVPTYLSAEQNIFHFKFVKSYGGELTIPEHLPNFKDGSELTLCGGIINQCHRETYRNLLDHAIAHNLSSFTIRVPLRSVYFQTTWREFSNGQREYGINSTGALTWQIPEPHKDSYNLFEIYKLQYEPGWGGRTGMFRILASEQPINNQNADSVARDNLDRVFETYFLSGYVNKLDHNKTKVTPHFSLDGEDFRIRTVLKQKFFKRL